MTAINKEEKCIFCGRLFRTLRSGDTKEIKVIQDFLINAPPGNVIRINTPLFMLDPKSDLFYGLCPQCGDRILTELVSGLIRMRRKILFQNFDELRKKLKDKKQ